MKRIGSVSEQGFALIAAILALMILLAVGVLVFTVTNQDIRVSSRVLGEKRAFLSAEAGIHELVVGFDPIHPSKSATDSWQSVGESSSQFKITSVKTPDPGRGPAAIPLPGYNLNAGDNYGLVRNVASVTGRNTNYNSEIQIEVGMGYGPVDISSLYKQ
jgi:hypothetical protein